MKLSLCLATYMRADYIGQTLDTILPQLTDDVELVILDGASTDGTDEVVARHARGHPRVRYIRAPVKSGFDADYDNCVIAARGEYCWLVADDDLLVEGAVAKVLQLIAVDAPDLIVVDAEVRDRGLDNVLEERRLPFVGERRYRRRDWDEVLADTGNALSFVGCTVIRRDIWLDRQREPYFGSWFVHVGVIFQAPLERVTALGEALVVIRFGNANWSAKTFEIWMFKWPDLIWGFAELSARAKAAVTPREPWRRPLRLLLYRANGAYDLDAYRRFFSGRRAGAHRVLLVASALVPGRLANLGAAALLAARGLGRTSGAYLLLACSPYANGLSRGAVRLLSSPAWLRGTGAGVS
jgi:abequosyltransferase